MKESYTDLKTRLQEVIDQLQNEDLDLDKAIKLHEEGQKILDKIDIYLNDMEAKIKENKK